MSSSQVAELWIGDPSSELSLQLVAGGEGWPEYFLANLKGPGLTCQGRVAIHDPPGYNQLSKVFAEMDESWRGWEGEKVWRSADGELELRFSMSPVGGITIRVRLRDFVIPAWEVETELGTQSGDTLSLLAKQAKRFQAMLDSAESHS